MTESEDRTPEEVVEAGGPEGPTAPAGDADASPNDDAADATDAPSVEQQLEERTADLQRIQAEYVNYRKRVERDRAQARTQGEAAVLRSLLTVLDDIGRAEQHGELTGGFKAVADALRQTLKGHRLEAFGAQGDAFDPHLHEALFHAGTSPDVETTSVAEVVRVGYRVGDEVLRHAQVGVVDPGEAPAADGASGPAED
ncbi:MAG: nucleotide exchange factor GrpE [Aeromicrobium erythreum]